MLKKISVRRQVQEKQSADTENLKLQVHEISCVELLVTV